MKSKLSTFRRLSWRARLLLGQAWAALLLANVSLRFKSLAQVEHLLALFLHRLSAPGAYLTPLQLARLVDIAARHHILPMHCLQRSLVLQSFLTQTGREAQLKIGVHKQRGNLQAHAWVESGGIQLPEAPPMGGLFAPLVPYAQESL
jgi:hypothetical protein